MKNVSNARPGDGYAWHYPKKNGDAGFLCNSANPERVALEKEMAGAHGGAIRVKIVPLREYTRLKKLDKG